MLSKVTQLLCGGISWGQKSLLNLQKLESRRQGLSHGAWDLRKVPEGEEFYRGCASSARSYSYISLAPAGSQDQPRSAHSGQGMGWSRPRPRASCLRVEDHLTQNRSMESTEEIVPKGKPESGTERGDGVGLGGKQCSPGPGDFECGPLAGSMGLTWEQVRQAASQAPLRPTASESAS